ncbi:hypothetical protein QM467_13005 [Rhodoblastus sp. 17X3]|uniref:hypothetical protein n=1 Tax=Rhodoblastus sp. 17X3 TaxID=3047026 RepID=UPI0024B71A14|nr:hypothetical protein [Rhodoblastus sp. 17X3]MDI9848975.1 hypothetical protein [Rhodoblastus sp. 17X3]
MTMPRPRQRVRLEDGLKLDLNRLIRQNLVRPGATWSGTIRWSYRYSGEEISSGSIKAEMTYERRGWLQINIGGSVQMIDLVSAPRHFGGRQWYFICPCTNRRASTLWRPPGSSIFASRQTWGRQVAYRSQFETDYDRALSAAHDIRFALGGMDHVAIIDGFPPPKPKGMHWRTFEEKINRCEAYEAVCNQRLMQFLERLNR